jgi:hypothetical protein
LEVAFMKKILALVVVLSAVLAFSATSQAKTPEVQDADYGSCYSVAPICIGTSPVCMCNQMQQCFWACR